MENASKALIIAGAILLAILIISLGIIIFNQANSVVNNNAMSEVEIQQFNTKFTQYEGPAVRGATVNSMLQSVLTNNLSQDDETRKVEVVMSDNTSLLSKTATGITNTTISTSATYKVKCTYGDKTGNKGLVTKITVTKNATT